MSASTNFQSLLAATAMLGLFAGFYKAAVRWPGRPPAAAVTLAVSKTGTDTTVFTSPPPLAPPTPPTPPTAPAEKEETEGLPHRDNRPVFERGNWWARRPRLLHRYVGTVGGQPATALLGWQNPDSVSGSFYLHRQGPEYYLRLPNLPKPAAQRSLRHRGRMLEVEEHDWGPRAGEWQLRTRPGAMLTGTWRGGPTGRPQAVVLHEDYTGGVRLAIQTWWVHGRYTITDSRGYAYSSVSQVRYEFMHLPAPANVAPALRPVLSPGPANRRRLLLEGGSGDCITNQKLSVRLNDFGLFSYSYEEYCSVIGGGGDERYRSALLDLRVGRWITTESQLIPHYEAGLARLLARHLLRDDAHWQISRDSTWRRQLTRYLNARHDTLGATTHWLRANTAVSAEGGILTGAGLEIADWRGNYIQAFSRETFTWFIPYAELRPLVRPGTPLARMLAARGLW